MDLKFFEQPKTIQTLLYIEENPGLPFNMVLRLGGTYLDRTAEKWLRAYTEMGLVYFETSSYRNRPRHIYYLTDKGQEVCRLFHRLEKI